MSMNRLLIIDDRLFLHFNLGFFNLNGFLQV